MRQRNSIQRAHLNSIDIGPHVLPHRITSIRVHQLARSCATAPAETRIVLARAPKPLRMCARVWWVAHLPIAGLGNKLIDCSESKPCSACLSVCHFGPVTFSAQVQEGHSDECTCTPSGRPAAGHNAGRNEAHRRPAKRRPKADEMSRWRRPRAVATPSWLDARRRSLLPERSSWRPSFVLNENATSERCPLRWRPLGTGGYAKEMS